MFPGPTELRLIGCLIQSIGTPRSKSKYIDTKNQLADILTKGNFTRDEWNHLLNLFYISHFSSTACTAAMAKRAQQESGEERVTAKSRPMMNLTARTPSAVSSSASTNPVRTSYGYQDPGKSVAGDDRSGKPERPSPSGYSKEDYGQSWSSQEWKLTLRCVSDRGNPLSSLKEQFIIGNNETELELTVELRSFLDRVNDQVRKRQKRSSMNVTEDGERHSIIW